MKILIGTPVHVSKDYAMERWLHNVVGLTLETPADLLMIDNSPGLAYVEKVKGYCARFGIKNYKIIHLELPGEQEVYERVARCREEIRQEILTQNYDAWFSWECDQLIPDDGLTKLIKMMGTGDFTISSHSTWIRGRPGEILPELFGTTLIKRAALIKHGFILKFGSDPEMPDTWEPGEKWFKRRVLRDGGSSIEADGVLSPIDHLAT